MRSVTPTSERVPVLTARDVFTRTVRTLPPAERLRLTALILDDLTRSTPTVEDSADMWSDQDQRDLTAFTLQYAAMLYPEDEELV